MMTSLSLLQRLCHDILWFFGSHASVNDGIEATVDDIDLCCGREDCMSTTFGRKYQKPGTNVVRTSGIVHETDLSTRLYVNTTFEWREEVFVIDKDSIYIDFMLVDRAR